MRRLAGWLAHTYGWFRCAGGVTFDVIFFFFFVMLLVPTGLSCLFDHGPVVLYGLQYRNLKNKKQRTYDVLFIS